MRRDTDGWISEYQGKDALWIHDGNPRRPHALLTSGKHSNGFFNSKLVIPDEDLLCEAALDLLESFSMQGGEISDIQGVVGPQTGATKLAEFISTQVSIATMRKCFSASPAKSESEGVKSMVFTEKELGHLPGKIVVLCEDVLTTGGSVDLTANAVTNAGGTTLPFILVLVNRSGFKEVSGKKIIALIDHPMPMWAPDECPLCKEGSEAIRPKGPPEWARLNDSY